MASKATLMARALISAEVSTYLRQPDSMITNEDFFHKNDSGEIAVLPAAADESIAMAFHRMEKIGERYVVLATMFDGKGSLLEFNCESVTDSTNREVVNVPAHMTVRDWFDAYGTDSHEVSFTCNGEEFGFEISSLASGFSLNA